MSEDLGRASLLGTRSYSLAARHIDQTFLIDVCRPALPVAAGQKIPVVYVLDGNGAFGLTAQTAQMLQLGQDPIPPMLIVGIGYHFDRSNALRAQHAAWRTRDFTPTNDPAWLATQRTAMRAQGMDAEATAGGAAAFLRFLAEELKPFIAERYPAGDPDDQTLVGMSLGGLFALYALFEQPAALQRYVVVSPAVWWDQRMIFRQEAVLAARANDLPVRLFLAVGAMEEADGAPYWPVSGLAELAAALRGRNYPSLRMTHHVFPDEHHMSVLPAAVSRGLRSVFG
ncbi:MAG TPA: alpha/beta hydrolase-fold protein [Caulobacteraceae bacterium]|nr:alpha/beta hydrolase-fold protein [Caulobacteraceae bacterium]